MFFFPFDLKIRYFKIPKFESIHVNGLPTAYFSCENVFLSVETFNLWLARISRIFQIFVLIFEFAALRGAVSQKRHLIMSSKREIGWPITKELSRTGQKSQREVGQDKKAQLPRGDQEWLNTSTVRRRKSILPKLAKVSKRTDITIGAMKPIKL